MAETLVLQIAQSRSYSYTLGPKVLFMYLEPQGTRETKGQLSLSYGLGLQLFPDSNVVERGVESDGWACLSAGGALAKSAWSLMASRDSLNIYIYIYACMCTSHISLP